MIDRVVDRQIPFLLFAERLLLELRDLRLMLHRRVAPLHVFVVRDVRRRRPRDLLAPHHLEMDDRLRRARSACRRRVRNRDGVFRVPGLVLLEMLKRIVHYAILAAALIGVPLACCVLGGHTELLD